MKKIAMFTAIVALGSLSLALAKPIVPKEPEKPKGPAQVDPLSAKMVNLNLDNVAVLDAMAELSRQSGYPIQVMGDTAPLRERKITLKTGEVSFFQAFDQLCLKGGLVESNTAIVRPPVKPLPQPDPKPGVRPNPKPGAQPGAQGGAQQGGAQAAPGAQIQVQVQQKAEAQPAPQAQAAPQAQPAPQALPPNAQVQPGAKAQPIRPIIRPNQFAVADGKPVELPTVYAGAVRIRLLPPSSVNMVTPVGEALLVFEVTHEPRLQSFNILGNPAITKAMDDLGQTLTVVEAVAPAPVAPGPNGPAVKPNIKVKQPAVQPQPANPPQAMIVRPNFNMQRIVTVRLKLGDKETRSLKELNGTLTAQVLGQPEPSATIDNVLQAKGMSAKTKNNDVTMILDSIDKVGEVYRAQVTMEYAPPQKAVAPPNGGFAPGGAGGVAPAQVPAQAQFQPAPGPIAPNPGVTTSPVYTGMPSLVDADGKVYQMIVRASNFQPAANPGGPTRRVYTIEYQANAGQGQPTRLVLTQTNMVQVPIPFSFTNVPLR